MNKNTDTRNTLHRQVYMPGAWEERVRLASRILRVQDPDRGLSDADAFRAIVDAGLSAILGDVDPKVGS